MSKLNNLNRMERILLTIIRQLEFTTVLGPYHPKGMEYSSRTFEETDHASYHVHFAPWHDNQIEPGMIVLCGTSGIHDFTVAEVVEVLGYSECLLRNLRDGSLCRMWNERFTPIIGLEPSDLWTDDQFAFAMKVRKAFGRLDSFSHLFGGVMFDGRKATISVREKWGGAFLHNRRSVPYTVEIGWNKRTTIKSIVTALQEAGHGSRKFESVLDLQSIGHSIKKAIVVSEQKKFDVSEFGYHEVIGGYRFTVFSDSGTGVSQMVNSIKCSREFSIQVLTKWEDEAFHLRAVGVKNVDFTQYYKRGFEAIAERFELEQVDPEKEGMIPPDNQD